MLTIITSLLTQLFTGICYALCLEVVTSIAVVLSQYTTVGNHEWFGKFIEKIEDKFKSQRMKDIVLKASYWKGFLCRSCHVFWLTLLFVSIFIPFKFAVIAAMYGHQRAIFHLNPKNV